MDYTRSDPVRTPPESPVVVEGSDTEVNSDDAKAVESVRQARAEREQQAVERKRAKLTSRKEKELRKQKRNDADYERIVGYKNDWETQGVQRRRQRVARMGVRVQELPESCEPEDGSI